MRSDLKQLEIYFSQLDVNEHHFYYTADTAGGDSGGPVYVEEGFTANGQWYSYKTVIGINSFAADNYNTGIRITPELLAFYNHNQKLN